MTARIAIWCSDPATAPTVSVDDGLPYAFRSPTSLANSGAGRTDGNGTGGADSAGTDSSFGDNGRFEPINAWFRKCCQAGARKEKFGADHDVRAGPSFEQEESSPSECKKGIDSSGAGTGAAVAAAQAGECGKQSLSVDVAEKKEDATQLIDAQAEIDVLRSSLGLPYVAHCTSLTADDQ